MTPIDLFSAITLPAARTSWILYLLKRFPDLLGAQSTVAGGADPIGIARNRLRGNHQSKSRFRPVLANWFMSTWSGPRNRPLYIPLCTLSHVLMNPDEPCGLDGLDDVSHGPGGLGKQVAPRGAAEGAAKGAKFAGIRAARTATAKRPDGRESRLSVLQRGRKTCHCVSQKVRSDHGPESCPAGRCKRW